MARPRKTKTGFKINLNQNLIDKQNITPAQVERIKAVHFEKFLVFEEMKRTTDPVKLKKMARKVKKIEFELQRLWGFDLNPLMHDWFLVPKCKCPKSDNRERRGMNTQLIDSGCPIHGSKS